MVTECHFSFIIYVPHNTQYGEKFNLDLNTFWRFQYIFNRVFHWLILIGKILHISIVLVWGTEIWVQTA